MKFYRNRFGALMLMLAVLLSSFCLTAYAEETAASEETVCYTYGDVNQDGVVNSRDAIYTLYASIHETGENYPLNQNADFNQDGFVTQTDAIWMLYAALGMGDREVGYGVHNYYDPVWTWTEVDGTMTATVALNCTCGEDCKEPVPADVEITDSTTATCTGSGSVTYKACATIADKDYSDVRTVTVSALGHSTEGEPTCTNAVSCSREDCDYEIPATGHSFTEKVEAECKEATCTAAAVEVWKCACGKTQSRSTDAPLGHKFVATRGEPKHISVCTYEEITTYTCSVCGESGESETKTYDAHTCVGATTVAPTCQTAGKMTYTCSVKGCNYSEEKKIEIDPNAHSWEEGEPTDGVTTWTCSYCGTTKTTVAMDTETGLSAAAISSDSEITLSEGASVALDSSTVEGLALEDDQTVVINIENITDSFENTTNKAISAVYDLTMTVGEDQISNFAGSVTVSLPYTLQPGDDINAIDVYFISDSNELILMKGTYSGGFVTFTTNHFSHYAIFVWAPGQICEAYGHQELVTSASAEPTCEEDGYVIETCLYCGYSEFHSDKTMRAKGHRFDEISIIGHCTDDISYTRTCQDCNNYSETLFFPAIGHNLVQDDAKYVAPTCDAPGKKVYSCNNICNSVDDPMETNTCTHTVEEVIPATGHSYETTVVEPTCTTAGYTLYTCTNCGGSYQDNVIIPTGHTYTISQPVWSEDYRTATVTLGCENCNWNRTLTAVISVRVSAASCNTPGTKTITAKTAYNQKVYEFSVTESISALDHSWSEGFLHDATQHYKECARCGEKQEAGNHSWNDGTVTLEPTCTASGSKLQTCSVCSREKTSEISATGHNYVDGVCTGCGGTEIDCNHIRYTTKTMDLTGYDICEGTKLILQSCECGQQAQVNWYNAVCDFEHSFQYVADDFGGYFLYINRCKDCGLTLEMTEYRLEIDKETCTAWSYNTTKISIGDTVLADTKWVMPDSKYTHPLLPGAKLTDLTEFGLCGVEIYSYSCPCGTVSSADITNTVCNFEHDSEQSDKNLNVFVCTNCGATMHRAYSRGKAADSCEWVYTFTNTYFDKDGNQVYNFSSTTSSPYHDYEVESYILDNPETCEDGIYICYKCPDCGNTKESFYTAHININSTKTDISDANICSSSASQSYCPCGQHASADLNGDENCQWTTIGYKENEETGVTTQTHQCDICSATWIATTTCSERDEDCNISVKVMSEYYDKDNNHIFTGYRIYPTEEHDYTTRYTFQGLSCEDGVTISNICKDCGYSYSETIDYHKTGTVKTHDISAFGMCSSTLYERSCPCGQEKNLSGYHSCSWDRIRNEENSYTNLCSVCGVSMTVTTTYGQRLNACQYEKIITFTFEKDGIATKTISLTSAANYHAWVSKVTPLGTSCTDGMRISRTCQLCNATEELSHWPSSGHQSEPVKRTILTGDLAETDKLCGELDLVTETCACGAENETSAQWRGPNACDFFNNGLDYYDEDLGTRVRVCSGCGAERYDTNGTWSDVKGDPCQRRYTATTHFRRDGKELFSFEWSMSEWEHLGVYSFQNVGESSDDGYNYTATCYYCQSIFDTGYVSGCQTFVTDIDIVNAEGICQPIIQRHFTCPCGAKSYTELDESCCDTDLGRDDTRNANIYTCSVCGLEEASSSGETYRVEGTTCTYASDSSYTYSLNDTVIGQLTQTDTWGDHIETVTFESLGDTCDDGYRIYATCQLCGESWWEDDIHYGCEEMSRTAVEIIRDDRICGYISLGTWGCPCTLSNKQTVSYHGCSFNPYGWDEKTASEIYECTNCGLLRYTGYGDTVHIDDCHYYYPISNTYYLGEECLGTLSYNRYDEWHTVDYSFRFPNGGDSCTDGYYVDEACTKCDYTSSGTTLRYDHKLFNTKIDAHREYGICEGTVIHHQCACGQSDYWESYICWDKKTGEIDEETGLAYRYCSTCNTTLLRGDINSSYKNCQRSYTHRLKLIRDGEVLVDITKPSHCVSHEYEITAATLMNPEGNCDDGVIATYTCLECGDSYTRKEYGHTYRLVTDIDIKEQFNSCGYGPYYRYYECACGEEHTVNQSPTLCNWQTVTTKQTIDGVEHEIRTSTCDVCGLIRIEDMVFDRSSGNCYVKANVTITYSKEGCGSASYTENRSIEEHSYFTYTRLMDGSKTCEDGVLVAKECSVCGLYSAYEDNSHHDMLITKLDLDSEEFADYDLCGGYIEQYACACGQNNYCDNHLQCSWHEVEGTRSTYVDNNGVTHTRFTDACHNCDLTYQRDSWQEATEESCTTLDKYKDTFFIGETEIGTVTGHQTNTVHDYTISMSAVDGDCENGYTITMSCKNCDAVNTQEGSAHENILVEEIHFGNLGYCSGYAYNWSCACGKSTNYTNAAGCDWELISTTGNVEGYLNPYYDKFQCKNCGLIRECLDWDEAAEDNCTLIRHETYTYSDKDGTKLFTAQREVDSGNTSHDYALSFRLIGTTCEEGYYVDEICTDCGWTNSTFGPRYDNDYWFSDDYVKDLGICDGELYRAQCACGEWVYWKDKIYCNGTPTGEYDEESGLQYYYCEDCNSTYIYGRVNSKTANCEAFFNFRAKVIRDGVVLMDVNEPCHIVSHDYQIVDIVLHDPNGTCEDGITITYRCSGCGDSYSVEDGKCHSYEKCYADFQEHFGEDTCGGYARVYGCACGNDEHINVVDHYCTWIADPTYSRTAVIDGVTHTYSRFVCENCNLVKDIDRYGANEESTCAFYVATTFSKGDAEPVTITQIEQNESHNFQETYTLVDGATSCTDGVVITDACACGYASYSYTIYDHEYIKEIITMPDGTCGGYVENGYCPCGYATYCYDYLNCNFVYQSTDLVTGEDGPDYNIFYYSCSCGLSYAHKYYTEYPDSCTVVEHNTYTYYLNDAKVGEFTYINTSYTHEYVNTSARLLDGSTTCEDGVQITETCTICNRSSTYTSHSHTQAIVDGTHIDFAQYCGCDEHGVYQASCACGETLGIFWVGSMSRSSLTGNVKQDENGISHYLVHYKMNYCDVYFWHEKYSISNGDGTSTKYQEYRFTYSAPSEDDVVLGTIYCKSTS